jgi:hypothetical protein
VNIFQVEGTVAWAVALAVLALKIAALVISLLYSDEAYRAADRLTKAAWAAILGIGLAAELVLASTIINLAFTIAALVFFLDVRPAMAGLRRR